ncbi:polysaccharide biosynthesis-like protein [gamma proteobacterium BDW918]|nr:polysaccharide biosynthesis-like protein [gamma proteobacterium BDW918]
MLVLVLLNIFKSEKVFKIIGVLLFRGGGSAATVLVILLVSRYLDVGQSANFFLYFNASIIMAICFRWGLDEVIVRKVASSSSVRRDSYLLIFIAHKRVGVWLVAAFLSLVCYIIIGEKITNYYINYLEISLSIFSASLVALVACSARVMQGMGRVNLAAFWLNIFVPVSLLVCVYFLVNLNVPINSLLLMQIYTAIVLASYIFVVALPCRVFGGYKFPAEQVKDDVAAANKLGVVVLSQQGLIWAAILIVPAIYGDVVYSGFVVVQKLASLIVLVMLAVNFTYSNHFAELYSAKNMEALRSVFKSAIMVVVLASFVMLILLYFFKVTVFEYARINTEMGAVLLVLCVAQVLFSISSVCSVVLSMCHDEKYLMYAQGSINLIGVLLFYGMSRAFYIDVACISFIVSYAVLAVTLGRRVSVLLKRA